MKTATKRQPPKRHTTYCYVRFKNAAHILALIYTGFSACRPPAIIVAATPSIETARRLRLHWGVEPIVVERAGVAAGVLTSGEKIVVAASRENPRTPSDTI